MYMLFDLEPAKELTGGPWYTEQELDSGFIEGTGLGTWCVVH